MKKYIVLIVLAFAASFCFAYSKPKKTSSKEVVKTGGIKVYGNEPFTFIGFSCDDGELYTLIGSDKLISELSSNQGYHLEIKAVVVFFYRYYRVVIFHEHEYGMIRGQPAYLLAVYHAVFYKV